MKIKKSFVVFLPTFLIGCASVLLTIKISGPDQSSKTTFENNNNHDFSRVVSNSNSKPEISKAKNELKPEPEILEENFGWKNERGFNVGLLETGEGFHGDEIAAKSGETWIGLFKEKDSYRLRSTKIKVARVEDVIVDDPGEKTGKSVAVKGGKALFLLKNAKMLRDGIVAELYDGTYYEDEEMDEHYEEKSTLRDGFAREFRMNGKIYTLKVKSGFNKKREPITALILESEGKSQTLHSFPFFKEGNYLGELYWVGDLDRDEKPDFYFNLYVNDNMGYKNLFLSSQAKKGKLVKKIATFKTSGC